MAAFSVDITAAGRYGAALSGTFSGGDPAYRNYRRIHLLLTDGYAAEYADFYSREASGADNTFSGSIGGLSAGTAYQWSAVLQYYDAAGWHDSGYTDLGSFATGPEVQAWIWHSGWKRAQPWVWRDGWRKGSPWLYQNEEWK